MAPTPGTFYRATLDDGTAALFRVDHVTAEEVYYARGPDPWPTESEVAAAVWRGEQAGIVLARVPLETWHAEAHRLETISPRSGG